MVAVVRSFGELRRPLDKQPLRHIIACTYITEIRGEHAHIMRGWRQRSAALYLSTACKAVRETSMRGEGFRELELEDRQRR
jgi:hypothetical protein